MARDMTIERIRSNFHSLSMKSFSTSPIQKNLIIGQKKIALATILLRILVFFQFAKFGET